MNMKRLAMTMLLCAGLMGAGCVGSMHGRTQEKGENKNMNAISTAKHHVLLEATSDGAEQWTGVLNNVENAREALGPEDTQVEVVVHGKGLGLLLKENNPVKDRVMKLAGEGVIFAACENTMKRKQVTKAELLPVATTVDSGVAEVVRKQEAGWSYIKTGH